MFLTVQLWMVAKSWQLSEISAIPQGQSQGKKQYLHCYWVLGSQPEECVRIFPISLPFWPFEPDSWLQFNSCNNTAFYGRDIRHSAISFHRSQNRCFCCCCCCCVLCIFELLKEKCMSVQMEVFRQRWLCAWNTRGTFVGFSELSLLHTSRIGPHTCSP